MRKILGANASVSPVITLEPRRRRFHGPMLLTVPLPVATRHAIQMRRYKKGEVPPTLRLLCSLTEKTAPAKWEDITGSAPHVIRQDTLTFSTAVSARFWLID